MKIIENQLLKTFKNVEIHLDLPVVKAVLASFISKGKIM